MYVLHDARVAGVLDADPDGALSFRYDDAWLDDGFPLSLSLPLRPEPFQVEAHRFFANLLPEGAVRRMVARRLGISEDSDWALLQAIGGDCAGALTLLPEIEDRRAGSWEDLSLERLAEMAGSPHPGLAGLSGEGELRLSLAGAQDKLPVRVTSEGDFQLPRGTAASTHIIKFASSDFAHLPANEVLVSRLARELGLPAVDVELDDRIDPPICVVQRYDRAVDTGERVRRIHQEDLCQALGLPHTRKYEREGGPGLGEIHGLLEAHAVDPAGDTRTLLQWIAFCVLAGNADGHAKNLSLLHDAPAPRLAPLYDLISTRAYPGLSARLALSVAGNDDPGQIGRQDWERLGGQLGVRPAFVVEVVAGMIDAVPDALERTAAGLRDAHGDLPALQMVVPEIRRQVRRSTNLLRR